MSESLNDCTPKLKALADETRWRIVQLLLCKEREKVTVIAEELKASQPSVSKHLRILREAGIIESCKERTTVWCSIMPTFRHRLQEGGAELDLGCCSFRFPEDGGVEKCSQAASTHVM